MVKVKASSFWAGVNLWYARNLLFCLGGMRKVTLLLDPHAYLPKKEVVVESTYYKYQTFLKGYSA